MMPRNWFERMFSKFHAHMFGAKRTRDERETSERYYVVQRDDTIKFVAKVTGNDASCLQKYLSDDQKCLVVGSRVAFLGSLP